MVRPKYKQNIIAYFKEHPDAKPMDAALHFDLKHATNVYTYRKQALRELAEMEAVQDNEMVRPVLKLKLPVPTAEQAEARKEIMDRLREKTKVIDNKLTDVVAQAEEPVPTPSQPQLDIIRMLKDRDKTHGKFLMTSSTAQDLKDVMHDSKNWGSLTTDQAEALEMIATKIARILNGDPNHRDAWADGAGYFSLVAQRLTP